MADDLTPYLQRIQQWDPSLDITSVRVDPYGLNNLVIIVDDTMVFRFPRSDASRAELGVEAGILATVRQYVDVAVPAYTYRETDDMVVYPLLPGKPVYRHDLLRRSDAVQATFAADVGRFLYQLHAIPPKILHDSGLAAPTPSSPERWAERLEKVRDKLYPFLWADQQAWIEDLFAPVTDGRLDMAAYQPCLIHNDLASYHLLGDLENGRLTGVLDFGSAGWGDPAVDLALLISAYGESFLSGLEAAYPLLQEIVERARVHAGYLELNWALKGLERNELDWYLVHLGRARDVRPYGVFPAKTVAG